MAEPAFGLDHPAGTAVPGGPGLPLTGPLPELATVYWRPRMTAERLRRDGLLWTLTTVGHVVPFVVVALVLVVIEPLALPVALVSLAHAWIIPELYAARGTNVVRPRPRPHRRSRATRADDRALGLLGDLVGHDARDGYVRTGLLIERAQLGVWLLGEAGALLLTRRGHRVHCFCVGVPEPALPAADRVAHLLLALRADEQGFATVANRAFSGARWRVRRRLPRSMRPALQEAASIAAHRPPTAPAGSPATTAS